MDDKRFKAQQRRVGVTAEDIARRAGRARSNVSHILTGKQRMSLDWAKVFAEVLNVPLAEVLERAGVADPPTAQSMRPGFADSDATPYQVVTDRQAPNIAAVFGQRPGVDVWQMKSASMILAGLLPGDFLLVDTHQADNVRPQDIVVAQVYNYQRGTASTVIRRLVPPVILSCPAGGELPAVTVVDGNNTVIIGKVVASWRMS